VGTYLKIQRVRLHKIKYMFKVEGDDMIGYKKEKYLNGQGTK